MKKEKNKYTAKQLMDLPKEEIQKLDNLTIPEKSEDVDYEAWRKRGIKSAKTAFENSVEAINIFLNESKNE